jgi:integrase
VYTVEDLIQLYGITRNTASNWIAEGLRPSDNQKPYVFNGAEVKRFHEARRLASKATLRIGQFTCFKCKQRVFPELSSLEIYPPKNGGSTVWAQCSNCKCAVNKRVNETDRDRILNCVITNTTLMSLDEGYEQAPVGIGKNGASENDVSYIVNDRILYAWLQFAGRFDQKTISAKLGFIRELEASFAGKSFAKIKIEDVADFRKRLIASAESDRDNRRSISTVRHCASHLKSFFKWLVDQKGYQSLNRSLPDHFDLPKKFDAKGLVNDEKLVPTDQEALAMIEGMATDTNKARRDRAMVAAAFLGALRADTITSLKVKHLNVSRRIITQDGQVSRTKNSKSLQTNFFPLPSIFEDVLEDWQKEVTGLGFLEDDALFPAETDVKPRHSLCQSGNIPVMNSIHAVSKAFRSASEPLGKRFTPHSAKHFIGVLGIRRCKTLEQQAAWSANMVHSDMETTRRYYQKLSQDQIDDVFESFEQTSGSDLAPEDMMLMLRYHEHLLMKGTPEFERAKALISEHHEKGTFE